MRIEITNFTTGKPNGARSESVQLSPSFAYEDGEYYEMNGGIDAIIASVKNNTFVSIDMSYTMILLGRDGKLQETNLKHMIVRGEHQVVDRKPTGAWAGLSTQEHFITFNGTKVMDLSPAQLGNFTTFTSLSELMAIFDNIKISSAHSINYVKHDSVGHHK